MNWRKTHTTYVFIFFFTSLVPRVRQPHVNLCRRTRRKPHSYTHVRNVERSILVHVCAARERRTRTYAVSMS